MITPPKPIKSLPLKTQDIDLWVNGLNTQVDAMRLGVQALTSTLNVLLNQDGTIRPSPSLRQYGPQPIGQMSSKPTQVVQLTVDGTVFWWASVQIVAGVAKLYLAKPEDSTWTECKDLSGDEVTFDVTARASYVQGTNRLFVFNGSDSMTYFDITKLPSFNGITRAVPIDDPTTAPTLAGTGFGTPPPEFNVYYTYTWLTEYGETKQSPVGTINVNTDRYTWKANSQSVAITVPTAPTGATGWNLYCATSSQGASPGTPSLIASNQSASSTKFTDDGSIPLDLGGQAPQTNTTDGPHAKYAELIGNNIFAWGDPNNPYMLFISGQGKYQTSFSLPYGYQLPVGDGAGSPPISTKNFRSGPGEPEIKCFTDDRGHVGKRYTIAPSTLTSGGNQYQVWTANQDYGYNGSTSANSVVQAGNSLYYLASDGIYTTGTEPQLQNLLDTHNVAQTLSPEDFLSINQTAVEFVDGSVWQNRLYFCVPVGANRNNQIWTLDLARGGAWMKPLLIDCTGIFVCTDNMGRNHQMFLVGNKLYESTYEQFTTIDNKAFPTSFSTGAIGFSKDLMTWAQVKKIKVVLLRARGTINFTVYGWTRRNKLELVGSKTWSQSAGTLGYGWNENGYNRGNLLRWNKFSAPVSTTQPSTPVDIEIRKRVRYMLFSVSTTEADTDYNLSQLIPLFTVVGVENLR